MLQMLLNVHTVHVQYRLSGLTNVSLLGYCLPYCHIFPQAISKVSKQTSGAIHGKVPLSDICVVFDRSLEVPKSHI